MREDNDIKQATIADLLNIAQNIYSQYETGKIEWTAKMLIKLADFYGTSIDYLLGLTNDPRPYKRSKHRQKAAKSASFRKRR